MWRINQSRNTPYCPQGIGVAQRGNSILDNALWSLLLSRSQEEWDLVLPYVMRAYRSTRHFNTLETPNFFMLGRETRVPDHSTYHFIAPQNPVHEYMDELITCRRMAPEILHEQQWLSYSRNLRAFTVWQRWCLITHIRWSTLVRFLFETRFAWSRFEQALMQQGRLLHFWSQLAAPICGDGRCRVQSLRLLRRNQ